MIIYDPGNWDRCIFSDLKCPKCGATEVSSETIKHVNGCANTPLDTRIGKRVVRAILLHSLESGVGDNGRFLDLPLSLNELREQFPEALAEAKRYLSPLLGELEKIKKERGMRTWLKSQVAAYEAQKVAPRKGPASERSSGAIRKWGTR